MFVDVMKDQDTKTPAPIMSDVLVVEPQWIDWNGHLNMAYYNVLFDRGADQAFARFGITPEYLKRGFSTFSAEFHVCYLREIHEGAKVRVSFQLLDHDDKRFHFFQEMIHEDGWVSATGEGLGLHIDMSGPRVAPFPEDVAQKVKAMMDEHAALPWPDRAGRKIGIPRKGK